MASVPADVLVLMAGSPAVCCDAHVCASVCPAIERVAAVHGESTESWGRFYVGSAIAEGNAASAC